MEEVQKITGNESVSRNPQPTFNPYQAPINSTRRGAIFQSHSYPTKINYRSIIPFILAHTQPGDLVYDCFAGTCSTGLAAAACADPDESVLSFLDPEEKDRVNWGPRQAICLDVGVSPTFIGRTLLNSIDRKAFTKAFYEIINKIENKWGWIYEAEDHNRKKGEIRYTFFSEVIQCPECRSKANFMDLFVDFEDGKFLEKGICPNCKTEINSKDLTRVTEEIYDPVLKTSRTVVKRVPMKIFGETHGEKWNREFSEKDDKILEKIENVNLPEWVEPIPMLWGELYRAGYHQGIVYLHHFYTTRNFLALTILYDQARRLPKQFRNPFKFTVSSYNATHSTLMTRFIFKKGKKEPVVTSAQPGVLYIGSCPVEKNVFQGVKRKFKTIKKAMDKVRKWRPNVKVYTRPAQNSGLDSNSIDYIFTDPPFGNNIQYSEINFLLEAWLKSFTDNTYEAVINTAQNKSLTEYEDLLKKAFQENFRVLKAGHFMTVVFHNTNKNIWNSLRRAILHSGFEITDSSILDKEQTSFKQTTTSGAVKKDPVLVARKPFEKQKSKTKGKADPPKRFLQKRLKELNNSQSIERTFDYLFGRYVGNCITAGQDVEVNAKEFRRILGKIAECREGKWYSKGETHKQHI